jgi:hypothetical protein
MFGHMKAEPILRVRSACPVEEAIEALIKATDETQAVCWQQFWCLSSSPGTHSPGHFTSWIGRPGLGYGSISRTSSMAATARETLRFWWGSTTSSALVERPGLLRSGPGWLLLPGRAAEMFGENKCGIRGTC